MDFDFWSVWMGLNICLSVFTMVLLLIRRKSILGKLYTDREKMYWLAFFLMSLFIFEAAVENFYLGNQAGPRVIIGTTVLLSIDAGLFMKPNAVGR